MALRFLFGLLPALAALVIGGGAQAQYALPAVLVTNGIPVHPICFLRPDDTEKQRQIDLGTCAKRDGYTIRAQGIFQPETGFIGSSYDFAEPAGGRLSYGFVEYKYLGKLEDEAIILIHQQDSQSGGRTDIYRATRNDNIVTLISLISGDGPCKNGLVEEDIEKLAMAETLRPEEFGEVIGSLVNKCSAESLEMPNPLEEQ